MEETKPGDAFPKVTYFPDGSSEWDYGDLVLPCPPPDRPLREWPEDLEGTRVMEEAMERDYAKRPGYEEWLQSPGARKRFIL